MITWILYKIIPIMFEQAISAEATSFVMMLSSIELVFTLVVIGMVIYDYIQKRKG